MPTRLWQTYLQCPLNPTALVWREGEGKEGRDAVGSKIVTLVSCSEPRSWHLKGDVRGYLFCLGFQVSILNILKTLFVSKAVKNSILCKSQLK